MSSSYRDTMLSVVLSFGRSFGTHTCKNVLPSWLIEGVKVGLSSWLWFHLVDFKACVCPEDAGGLSELVYSASPVHAPGLGQPITGERGKQWPLGLKDSVAGSQQAILSNHLLSDEDIEAAQGTGRFWCQVCN